MRTGEVFAELKAPLTTVLLFSLVINVALLAPSIFMLQVFDRVLSTRSVETLLMLGILALATLVMMGVLDHYRARTLAGIGIALEQRHGPRLLSQLMAASVRNSGRGYLDGMRDLSTLRAFLGGPGVVALCDAPWTLVYLVIIFLFHPALGLMACVCTALLVGLALLNQRLTRSTLLQLRDATQHTGRLVDGMLRNAETVTSMGLTDALGAHWRRRSLEAQRLSLRVARLGGAVTASSRV